jgi:hypothetical protein
MFIIKNQNEKSFLGRRFFVYNHMLIYFVIINNFFFLTYKVENFRPFFRTNRDSLLLFLLRHIKNQNFFFLINKNSNRDSLLNVKNCKINLAKITKLYFDENQNIFENKKLSYFKKRNKIILVKFRIYLDIIFKFFTHNKYIFLKLRSFKLIIRKATSLFSKKIKIYVSCFLLLSYSFKNNFNRFFIIILFNFLISAEYRENNNHFLSILCYFFPNINNLKHKNVSGIMLYVKLVLLVLFYLGKKEKCCLNFYLLFVSIFKFKKNIYHVQKEKLKIIFKIFSFFHLSKFIRNKLYLFKSNFGKKKKEFFFVKCKKCLLFFSKLYLKEIYFENNITQSSFVFLKTRLFLNMIKNIDSYKNGNYIYLFVLKIKKKKIKIRKAELFNKIIFRILDSLLSNVILNSQKNFKKLLYLASNKFILPNRFIFFLFLIDSTIFHKVFYQESQKKSYHFFKNIIFNKLYRRIILSILAKLNIFKGLQKIVFYEEKYLDNLFINNSNLYILYGPNRSHTLKKINIYVLNKKISTINSLRISNDLLKIVISGIFSRFIYSYITRILYNKKQTEKNQHFQLKEILLILICCFFSVNFFYLKFSFFLYQNFFCCSLNSFHYTSENFILLLFFTINNFTKRQVIKCFYLLCLNKKKQTSIIIRKGICLIIQKIFSKKIKISFREKILKYKILKKRNTCLIHVFNFFLKQCKKKIFDDFILKIFFEILLIKHFSKKKSNKKQEIIILLINLLKYFVKLDNNKKKIRKVFIQLIFSNDIFITERTKIMLLSENKRIQFSNWTIIHNILVIRIFIIFICKYNINCCSNKKKCLFFNEILDISELPFIYNKKWKKKIQNLLNVFKFV